MSRSTSELLRVGVGGGYIGTTVGGQFAREPRSTVAALTDVDAETLRSASDALAVTVLTETADESARSGERTDVRLD